MSEELTNPFIEGIYWRHLKTGREYRVTATGIIKDTLTPCVIYEDKRNGLVWVRPIGEFLDGRFEKIARQTTPPTS